jgi:CelD/BcsL family acetyltransferase involved in cellulose biosynthesis
MRVFCLSTLDELAPYADAWDRLAAGIPFRSWIWLSTWWRHYGGGEHRRRQPRSLFVPCVFDEADMLVGLAPWYFDYSAAQGRALRTLGCGEVCSDYLGVLCQKGMEEQVTDALAECLAEEARAQGHNRRRWDLLELAGVDAEDEVIGRLVGHLGARGNTVHRRWGPNCWRLELPASWEDYLAILSKNRRHRLRRFVRDYLDNGRAVLRAIEHVGDLPRVMDLLVDLHQRRRHSLGQRGCFASPRFTAFYREVVPALFRNGQLQFYCLELDGKPVSAEYLLVGGGVLYGYQAGLDPDALDDNPGYLMSVAILRRAIAEGYRVLDFLRGDEPYKAYLRAKPRPSLAWRVVPDRAAAQLRHNFWLAGNNVKRWIKNGLLSPARPMIEADGQQAAGTARTDK